MVRQVHWPSHQHLNPLYTGLETVTSCFPLALPLVLFDFFFNWSRFYSSMFNLLRT